MGSNGVDESMENNSRSRGRKGCYLAQIVLRSLAGLFALTSIIVMVKSGQSTTVFGIEFLARYHYSSAFRFLLGADIAICVFSVISLITLCAFYGPISNPKCFFSAFLSDLVGMVLMMSACAAATAIGYVGRYGQDETGWTKICDNVAKFCNFITVSIAFSYLSFICLFALTILAFVRANNS